MSFEIPEKPRFWLRQNGPRTQKNRGFLKSVITLPKASAIDPANHISYGAFRRPPKNRCFWRSRPENPGFWPIPALF